MTTTMTTSPYVLNQLLTYKKAAPVEVDSGWARVILSFYDIPDEFRGSVPATAEFPYTVYLAEENGSGASKKRPAQLLSLYRDHLIVREAVHGQVSATGYPFQAISKIEHGRRLLDSWVKITTRSSSTMFAFNTVTEQVMEPVIQALRSGTHQPETVGSVQKRDSRELSKLSYLWSRNMEYFHMAQESILSGTKILGSVYQPEQPLSKRKRITSFGKNQELPGHVAILTDHDMILINKRQADNGAGKLAYGTITTYLPMAQIQHVSFQKLNGIRDLAIEITLFDYTWKRMEFSSETAVNLSEFQTACRDEFGSRTN